MSRARGSYSEKYGHWMCVLAGFIAVLLPAPCAAQNSPAGFSGLASKAATARVENDLPRAIQLYGQALQLNPEWKEGWWYLGLLQYEANSYPAARDALTRYIALD